MPPFLMTIGPEILLTLALLALLGFRVRVTPRASLWIAAPPAAVFALVDIRDGRTEHWGRTTVKTELIEAATGTFRKTYRTTLSTGMVQTMNAFFRIAQREEGVRLVLVRAGLEKRSLNNELLEQDYRVAPEKGGTRLSLIYRWGPRPLLAQIMARADLWGGIYRLKALAETGRPDDRAYQVIAAGIAIATGLVTLAGFAYFLGLPAALLLILALFVHEFGHLLAYRLMGQPWGRMVFLPFMGAIAYPRLPYDTQGQVVFSALMGPGFSILLALACVVPWALGMPPSPYVTLLGIVTVALNLFNLLPVEPLDGGVALRSILNRVIGRHARFGLMIVGALIAYLGFTLGQIILVLFGAIAIFANLRDRMIDAGLAPMSSLQLAIAAFAYVALAAAYVTLLRVFVDVDVLLQRLT